MEPSDDLKNWLRKGLSEKGKSQAGLAKALNLSELAVTKLVSGVRAMTAEDLLRASDYFGVKPPERRNS